jgi:cytochrome P450
VTTTTTTTDTTDTSTTGGTPTAARFEPRSGEGWRDPFPMYRALRDHDPVHHVEGAGGTGRGEGASDYWVLSRHADVQAAAHDAARFSSAQGLSFRYDEMAFGDLGRVAPMVFLDPPDHTEFRRLVARGFTPRQVADIEPIVRRFVTERLDALVADGGGDIVERLLKPLPPMVVGHYLGVPPEDRERFDGWVHAVVAATATEDLAQGAQALAEVFAYFAELAEARRADPGDDAISELVQAGDGADIDPLRIIGFAFTMMTGGNDTSTGLLGVGLDLLARHPDQRDLLARRPDLVPGAVNELLRLSSPVQGLARTVVDDTEVGGVTIPAGRKVLLLYASANRDPRQFGADAEELDVTRPAGPILTFGHGAHFCLGAAAARLMGRVTLEEVLARCPQYRVDAQAGRFAPGNFVRRYESLPFEPGPRAR